MAGQAEDQANVQFGRKLPPSRPRTIPAGEDADGPGFTYIDCDVYQACTLNLMLPKGFKLEQEDTIRRAMHTREVQRRNMLKQQQKTAKAQQLANEREAAK